MGSSNHGNGNQQHRSPQGDGGADKLQRHHGNSTGNEEGTEWSQGGGQGMEFPSIQPIEGQADFGNHGGDTQSTVDSQQQDGVTQ